MPFVNHRLDLTYRRQPGFVILFAVILVSIVLTISLSLFNISFKQIILSSIGKESNFAFFIADSARECAHYHDSFTADPFGSYSRISIGQPDAGKKNYSPLNLPPDIKCAGNVQSVAVGGPDTNNARNVSEYYYMFNVHIDNNGRRCARVTVAKNDSVASVPQPRTYIASWGYNSCDPLDQPISSDRTVQQVSLGDYSN